MSRGLYEPREEHDACGLGFVADTRGDKSRRTVLQGLEVLRRLAHRGAAGADADSGDGAGILTQMPHAYFELVMERAGFELPLDGDYGVAQVFLSRDSARAYAQMYCLEEIVRYHGQKVVGWRDVPVDPKVIGPTARESLPWMRQLFIARMCPAAAFERTLFMIRKRAGKLASRRGFGDDLYFASCSSKSVVYKGLALPERLGAFYRDLADDRFRSKIALVHSRFSTNTFPTWERAHPYRRIAHNGEINTLRGNQNWMAAREALLASTAFGEHIEDFKPIIRDGGSDSSSLDNVVDFLLASGRSLPHVMMMLVPEAYRQNPDLDPETRAFYAYHASLVEPWDGPAALAFTDGERIGAMVDRNGLRPAKYVVTDDGLVVLASELGVVDIPTASVIEKGQLAPGRMLMVDTRTGRIHRHGEIAAEVVRNKPYAAWVESERLDLQSFPEVPPPRPKDDAERTRRQVAFGYTREDLRVLLAPMAETGEEPVGSMGVDTPLAVLSELPLPLFRYFKQQFAQVTNPPIDPIREALVMSLGTNLGSESNLLDETKEHCHLLSLDQPILDAASLARLSARRDFPVTTLALDFRLHGDAEGSLRAGLDALLEAAEAAVDDGAMAIVLSDRDAEHASIPSLLAVAAVHHRLIKNQKRAKVGLVVECGDAREVADVALLLGYGAGAVHPWLALETVSALSAHGDVTVGPDKARANYTKALQKGLLKVLSKLGISTLSSYQGAQIFEAIGLSESLVATYFCGTSSKLSGIGLKEIAEDVGRRMRASAELPVGGVYAWRTQGERHLWTPDSVAALQRAVRLEDAASYDAYARMVNEPKGGGLTLRAQWSLRAAQAPVDLAEVEPATQIVRRFATGAMSFGSISAEAHENLALAMNRIGGKSNTGEGGEDPVRLTSPKRSAIKQIASGRFGVTTRYLVNADELQIKMAQGAKPGEGGQLPGHKVDAVIARVRHSTEGVTLISPPPHHDIYSIEDLAQLIYDLRSVNPTARISVKLVSESGVGTIAAGVAKAHADVILIAGHDGGTGASPLSSIQHAGTPWELGLAEAAEVLTQNGLRGRVVLQADGQMKTGRDVAMAALLGADEFGFATAPLVASGCIMMRKCHLNTCPVGVATQDPVLRARFAGTPEHVIRYFFYVAEELRRIMAELGFRTLAEMVGRRECIGVRDDLGPRAATLDFSRVLAPLPAVPVSTPHERADEARACGATETAHELEESALGKKLPARVRGVIVNANRTFGARVAGELARRNGTLAEDALRYDLTGTAGQSFGAFAVTGMTLSLEGDANDYVGKGLSGGILAIRPPVGAPFVAADNVIVGNTVLYGATSGRAFFAGRAGARFAVRNSGATAVVEGVGDHGCEYMTGGTVLVLGPIGRNFAAGMSGGVAYVLDAQGDAARRINGDLVDVESDLDDGDRQHLRALLEEHATRTHSARAAELLADLANARFLKIIPREYKKLLERNKPPLLAHG